MSWFETRTAELPLLGRNWYRPMRWFETRTAELRLLGRNWYQPVRWFESRTAELPLLGRNWYQPMRWFESRTAELPLLGRNWYRPVRWFETRTVELRLVRDADCRATTVSRSLLLVGKVVWQLRLLGLRQLIARSVRCCCPEPKANDRSSPYATHPVC
jgi:hypothetical protein